MMKIPGAPEANVNYGVIRPECEAEFKNWIRQVLSKLEVAQLNPKQNRGFEEQVVNALYDELTLLGYREGYSNAQEELNS